MCVDYSSYNDGIIFYETRGASPNQQLVVEWWEISRLGNFDHMTFEAILNETGEIWFQYATLNGMTGSSATIGIEDSVGTDACSYSYNTASLSDNMSIRFSMPPVTIESDQDGYALPGEDEPYTLTITNYLGFADSFDLTAVSENGWTVTFYDATGTVPLVDTNGDAGGHPDTGDIAPGTSINIVVNVTVPLAPGVSSDITNVTATSFTNPLESDMCTLTTHVFSQFGGSHADHGQDDTGNGKFDWLVIEAEVNVSAAGTFNVLCDMYNQAVTLYVTYGINTTALGAGLQTVWIFLDGMTINSRGVDGPYTVYLYLYDEFWTLHDSVTYLTAAYSSDDFQCIAEFEPPHSDSGNNTDADPYFEYLLVEAVVNATVAGNYRVDAYLYNTTTGLIESISSSTFLGAGINIVEFMFDGMQINTNGGNGPYEVQLELYDMGWNLLDVDAFNTSAYLVDDFQPLPPAFTPPFYDDFETGIFGGSTSVNWTRDDVTLADVGMQTSNSGIYSMYTMGGAVTVTSWTINLTSLSEAQLRCWIQMGSDLFSEDPDPGEDLLIEYRNATGAWNLLDTFTDEGVAGQIHKKSYILPADAIGPDFQVRFRQLGGSGPGNDYWHIDDVYVGEPISHFEPPHADWGRDTDGNSRYEHLVVEVALNITDDGEYTVEGYLYDMFSNEIGHISNTTDLLAGLRAVELWFDGGLININGVNGPYTVDLTLSQTSIGVIDGDTHTTNAFLFSEFDLPPRLTAPWYEDFESGSLEGTSGYNWSTTDTSLSGVNMLTSNSGDYSMYTMGGVVTVSSWYINLSGLPEAQVICWIQRGDLGFSESPGAGDNLVLEYYSDFGFWNFLQTFLGSGPAGEEIVFETTLPADALHSDFRLRFRQIGGGGIGNDYWHIDDVYVGPPLTFAALAPPHSESTPDLNGDGLYDSLTIGVNVSVADAGVYIVSGTLRDSGTLTLLGTDSESVYLTSGMHSIDLRFPGGPMNTSGLDGPYEVTITLDHGIWGLLETGLHVSSAYLASEFNGPNVAPIAEFQISPLTGDTATSFSFDASNSSDVEDPDWLLGMRWDWDSDGTWDTSWASLGTAAHSFATPGTYNITLEVRDSGELTGIMTHALNVSEGPPITSAELSGTEGSNGWYTSEVEVTLTATDDASGVNYTMYRIGSGDWEEYTSAIVLDEDGEFTVYFYSVDNLGLTESTKSVSVSIDATPPSLSIDQEDGTEFPADGAIVISWTASDATSGLSDIEILVDGGSAQPLGAAATSVDLAGLTAGEHYIIVRAVDEAGLETEIRLDFTVEATTGGTTTFDDI
ncbi:MAG TPA: hypothetical protein ENN25_06715 [Euryarchaeota archaeon]|nr:hypothetical protein [Euryarchaeota archaeon]